MKVQSLENILVWSPNTRGLILESLGEVCAVLLIVFVEVDICSHLKETYFLCRRVIKIFHKSDQSAVGWLAGPQVASERSPGIISSALTWQYKHLSLLTSNVATQSTLSKNWKRHFQINVLNWLTCGFGMIYSAVLGGSLRWGLCDICW